jgi:hypothetical protein
MLTAMHIAFDEGLPLLVLLLSDSSEVYICGLTVLQ